MSKIEFKEFVKKNPHLIKHVETGSTNWQKLYELYDLYGETNDIWNRYKNESNDTSVSNNNSNSSFSLGNNLKDIVNLVRGVDLNTVQKGLNSLDKAIEAFKGIIPDKAGGVLKDNYEPRPTYKYFED